MRDEMKCIFATDGDRWTQMKKSEGQSQQKPVRAGRDPLFFRLISIDDLLRPLGSA
jgi:hypothetical protein